MARIDLVQVRRDTAANWASTNPILALGEQSLETDTGVEKIGDGVTAYNSRPSRQSGTYARVFKPEAYGGGLDGTDESSAWTAMLAAIGAAGGGTVDLDPAKTYRVDSQIVHPGGYLRITSMGGGPSLPPVIDGSEVTSGPILDLRYTGSGAKLVALKAGTLQIDNIAVCDKGTSSTPFVLCTMAVPRIFDNIFQGNMAKGRLTADQDVLIFGGTDTVQAQDSLTSAFGGYGGYVRGNTFSRTRRAVWGRNFFNNIPIFNNTVDIQCGSDQTVDAPIVLDSGGTEVDLSHHVQGCQIRDNTIELTTGYAHGVILRNNARHCIVQGNGFWDVIGGGRFVSDVLVSESTGCDKNAVLFDGYSNTYAITGCTVLDGKTYVWIPGGEQWSAATAERKPAGWKMSLYGTDNYHFLDMDLTRSRARISGWNGLTIRSAESSTETGIRSHTATPEGAIHGRPGDICVSTAGGSNTTLYVKESGDWTTTGWIAYGGGGGL